MFKDGISMLGLTMKFVFIAVPYGTVFSLFGDVLMHDMCQAFSENSCLWFPAEAMLNVKFQHALV